MDTTLLGQLNDFDPAVRKQAIIALGRSKDRDALPYLATVVRTDPEPELRELARKAGQYIQQNAAPKPAANAPIPDPPMPGETPPPAASATAATAPAQATAAKPASAESGGYLTKSYSEYEMEDAAAMAALGAAAGLDLTTGDPDAAKASVTEATPGSKTPVPGKTYVVSDGNKDKARDILESALTANISGDNARAMRYLYQALMTDPNLINDDYYAKIASGVTELPRDQAIQMVINQGERKTFIKTQQKVVRDERKEKHLGEARKNNWVGVTIDAIFYLLIITGGPMAIAFAFTEGLNSIDPAFAETFNTAGINVNAFTFAFFLPFVLITAVSSVASLFVMGGIIHIVAVFLLRGTGTFADLLTRLLRLFNRYLLIIYILAFIAVILMFVTAGSPIFLCATIPIVFVSLFLAFKTLGVVGQAYDFGLAMGCLSVLAAYVVLVVISGAITALFANTILQVLSPLFLQGLPIP